MADFRCTFMLRLYLWILSPWCDMSDWRSDPLLLSVTMTSLALCFLLCTPNSSFMLNRCIIFLDFKDFFKSAFHDATPHAVCMT
jgi:hypothetical protein